MILSFETIMQDIISGILLTIILFLFTAIFLYCYINHSFQKRNIEKITKIQFFESFIEKFITDKLETKIFKESQKEQSIKLSPKNFINSVKDIKDIKENEVMIKTSMNHNTGANNGYSIETWYGINYTKLKEDTFKYICFKVRDENEQIYLNKSDLIGSIDKAMNNKQKKEYIKKKSLNVYLKKSLEDNKWYITRLGVILPKPIQIK